MPGLAGFGRFSEPALLVLVSLADGDKHGYAMQEDIVRVSGRRLGPGTLYGAIRRLEERRFIEPLPAADRRKPYRITGAGRTALREQLDQMRAVARTGLRRLSAAT